MLTTHSLNKQQMAEWLAEDVLGWIKQGGVWSKQTKNGWLEPLEETNKRIVDIIYSPDGFFAVWDAVEKRRGEGWLTIFKAYENGDFICTFELNMNPFCMGKGQDRYEAFYNAVYEAMNDSNA